MRYDDNPITKNDIDLLGYDEHAKRLAKEILDNRETIRNGHNSYTIGILGHWGTGKSSMMSLLESHIDRNLFTICRFNPWYYSSTEQLIISFFATIQRTIANECNFLTSDMKKAIGKFASLVLSVGASGLVTSPEVTIAAKVIQLITEQAKDDDIATLKEKIAKQLQAMNKQIIFFIDDLDRCMPDEIVYMLKLIRLIADFPNICYVIAFDHDHISQILETKGIDGFNYLQKFIQTPVYLYKPSEEVIFVQLERAFNRLQLNCSQKTISELAGCIPDLRAFKKYINLLEINLDVFRQYLNIEDYVRCTLLKAVMPVVFEDLKNYQFLWLDLLETRARLGLIKEMNMKKKEEEEELKRNIEEMMAHMECYFDKHMYSCSFHSLKQLLCSLFPVLFEYYHYGTIGYGETSKIYGECRFCESAYTDMYYQVSLIHDTSILALSYVKEIIRRNDNKELSAWITKMFDRGYGYLFIAIIPKALDLEFKYPDGPPPEDNGLVKGYGNLISLLLARLNDKLYLQTPSRNSIYNVMYMYLIPEDLYEHSSSFSEFWQLIRSRQNEYSISALLDLLLNFRKHSMDTSSLEEVYCQKVVNLLETNMQTFEVSVTTHFQMLAELKPDLARKIYNEKFESRKYSDLCRLFITFNYNNQEFRVKPGDLFWMKKLFGRESIIDEQLYEAIKEEAEATNLEVAYVIACDKIKNNMEADDTVDVTYTNIMNYREKNHC